MTKALHLQAPAKINRFLHIVGQRKDGYHLLQTVFQLIDLHDDISLTLSPDGCVHRTAGAANIPADDAEQVLQKVKTKIHAKSSAD